MGRLAALGYTTGMKQITTKVYRILFLVFMLGMGFATQADNDQDEARRLLESGDIMSLEMILEKIRPVYSGKILEVELETESGKTVYEIELLGSDGIVRELIIDARTGDLLRSERDD